MRNLITNLRGAVICGETGILSLEYIDGTIKEEKASDFFKDKYISVTFLKNEKVVHVQNIDYPNYSFEDNSVTLASLLGSCDLSELKVRIEYIDKEEISTCLDTSVVEGS